MATEDGARKTIAVLIDADNISAAHAGEIFKKVQSLGEPIARRAYGMVNCFSSSGGWSLAQREYGIVSRPQVSNISGKNVADIALVIDAMEFLYKNPCQGICIVSSDSDFSALASKIREGGKYAYGMGDSKTPASFRSACSEFFPLQTKKAAKDKNGATAQATDAVCPKCGGKLVNSWTKSNKPCKVCQSCGGIAAKLLTIKKSFSDESFAQLKEMAKQLEPTGCVCPDCGSVMGIMNVVAGKRQIEIDVCSKCLTVWYDKNELESIVPSDGVLQATVSAGKTYRREITLAIASDLRNGRRKAPNLTALKGILKGVYHVPSPDIEPVISTLRCQQVIVADKTGNIKINLAKTGAQQ